MIEIIVVRLINTQNRSELAGQMYNFYLHNNDKEQTFTDYAGTITIEEVQSLDNVWSYINAQTGYNFPVAVLDNPVVPRDILRQMYDYCTTLRIENNPDFYITQKAKRPYMLLYDNILSILDAAIKCNSDLWVELD